MGLIRKRSTPWTAKSFFGGQRLAETICGCGAIDHTHAVKTCGCINKLNKSFLSICTTYALVLESVSSERLLRGLLSTYLWAVKAGYPYYFCWALSIYFCELSSAADYDGKQNDHWFLHTDEAKFCWACLMQIREYTCTDMLSGIYMLSMLKKISLKNSVDWPEPLANHFSVLRFVQT